MAPRPTLAALFGLLIAACLATPNVREYLDESTAATITVATEGWIFARPRTDLAAHAQDYVTITPVQVNRSGERRIYLFCQLWSTIDRRSGQRIAPENAQLALLADDRQLDLSKPAVDLRRLGFGHDPVPAPNNLAEIRVQPADADLLRFMIEAERLEVLMKNETTTDRFTLWRDGREAASNFLRQIAAAR